MEIIEVVVHNGTFHADDCMAVAILRRAALIEGFGTHITRVANNDWRAINAADIRLDVGGRNNPGNGDIDHHQEGGAGRRWWNGIPYAAAGLVWRLFGVLICGGNREIARIVENSLIQQIDAEDNGFSLYKKRLDQTMPVTVSQVIYDLNPKWYEKRNGYEAFWDGVDAADKMLERRLAHAYGVVSAREKVCAALADAEKSDPRIVVFTEDLPWEGTVMGRSAEALYAVYPDAGRGIWRVKCVPKGGEEFFEQRKRLPAEWAGKRGAALAEESGVPDATFCHPQRFTAGAVSREGALVLAKLAADA